VLHWYALNTLPRAEQTVAQGLMRWEPPRQVSVYLPMLPPLKRSGKVMPPTPLFPGYLFCRCDLAELPLSALRWLPGLRCVVGFDHEPAIVPDEAIQLIQERLAAIRQTGIWPLYPFRPGDMVQIKAGPLQGLLAVFNGPVHPVERVRILIEFLGRVNEVEVSPDLLEPVRNPPRRTRGRGRWIRPFGPGPRADEDRSTNRKV
jgi:transcription antitermination factor NusG